MKSKSLKQTISLWMIYLIILLPVVVAQSHSPVSITSIEAYGSAENSGYRKAGERVKLEITHNASDVANLIPRLNEYPLAVFTCEANTCYTLLANLPNENNQIFTVDIFSSINKVTTSPASISLISDANPPEIIINEIKQESANEIKFSLDVKDTLCDSFNCQNLCSGIQDLSIQIDGSVVSSQVLGHDCTHRLDFKAPTTFSGSGNADICVLAQDYAGHRAVNCQEVFIDRSTPRISEIKLTLN